LFGQPGRRKRSGFSLPRERIARWHAVLALASQNICEATTITCMAALRE
jgi:hypothetical protein